MSLINLYVSTPCGYYTSNSLRWLRKLGLEIGLSPRTSLNFTTRVKEWNYEVFGNLFARKKRVLARLNGVQKALA